MKSQNSKGKLHLVSNLLNSGSVLVNLNREEFARVDISRGNVDVFVVNDQQAKQIAKNLPHSLKKMKTIHLLSRIAARTGVTISVTDENGLVLRFGNGVHTIMGNFEVKLFKIRKYL
jgi:hypothetical protein